MMNVVKHCCQRLWTGQSYTRLAVTYSRSEFLLHNYTPRLLASFTTSAPLLDSGKPQNRLQVGQRKKPLNRFDSLIMKLGFFGSTKLPKHKLDESGIKLYVSCTMYAEFDTFKQRFRLPDTMVSWAAVVQLHMWMLMIRLRNQTSSMEKDVSFLTSRTNIHMWTDMEKKVKKLAVGKQRKKGLVTLGELYTEAVISYDEGYFTDDKTLASALWRCFFNKDENVEPQDLCLIIDYIHKNLHHLASLKDEDLLQGTVSFIHLDNDKPERAKDMMVEKHLLKL